jgi:hypothetical protein
LGAFLEYLEVREVGNVKVLGQAKIGVFPSSIFAGFLDVVFLFLCYDLCRITCA